ncbi:MULTISPECIES: FliH/SctL family protein [Zhongshania]|jgi:flagellar assembly protein FliH|uniref:Flagellar assembly protein FliH n=1 Tax=Zhongshania antarctica TaxID=641702 RepID=A0A840R011_9GAMM|nr:MULTISPECIES: FliH/SctL family protein [Zhongshania]MBB5185983.1 flagellar assembly protein FliH [Zhongshania antarctica]
MADVFQVFVPRVVDAEVDDLLPAAVDSTEASVAHRPWQLPDMSVMASPVSNAGAIPERVQTIAADQSNPTDTFEAQRKQAYDQGFQQGLAGGQQESRRLLAEQSQQLQLALAALREPLKWVDSELERELFLMTLAISKQLLRHELSLRPELIENLIHKAVSALPLSNSGFDISLNPADADVLRNLHTERDEQLDPAWRLIEDSAISRGGCRINSDQSRIDEELETRIQHVVAEMLGETMVPQRDADNIEHGV